MKTVPEIEVRMKVDSRTVLDCGERSRLFVDSLRPWESKRAKTPVCGRRTGGNRRGRIQASDARPPMPCVFAQPLLLTIGVRCIGERQSSVGCASGSTPGNEWVIAGRDVELGIEPRVEDDPGPTFRSF